MLKGKKEGLGAFSFVTLGAYGLVELRSKSESREPEFHTTGFFNCDTQVLDEMLNVEAWLKISSEHARCQLFERKTTGGTLLKKIDHLVKVKTSFMSVDKSLADTNHGIGD